MTAPHDEAVEVMVQAFTPMCAGFGHGKIPAGVARDFAARGAAALTAAGFTIERTNTIADLQSSTIIDADGRGFPCSAEAHAAQQSVIDHYEDRIDELKAEIADLRAQVAMLREAVKPFATQAHRYDDDEAENNYIWCKDHQGVFLEAYRVRDLRRARDAYDATGRKRQA